MNRRYFMRGLMASAAVIAAPALPVAAQAVAVFEGPGEFVLPPMVRMTYNCATEMGLPPVYWDVNTDTVRVLLSDLRAWMERQMATNKWITPEIVERMCGKADGA